MSVAYDSAAIVSEANAETGRQDFRRLERIMRLAGGLALGATSGFVAAIGIGRPSVAALILSGAAFETLALYLCSRTLRESLASKANGCTAAAVIQAAALLAWPLTGLFAPVSAVAFWAAPLLA